MSLRYSKLQPGQMMPDFNLATQNGRKLSISSFRNRANLVVIFIGDAEKAALEKTIQDLDTWHPKFVADQTRLLLVVPTSAEGNQELSIREGAAFPILLDPEGRIHLELANPENMKDLPPVVFVIDRFGEINSVYSPASIEKMPGMEELLADVNFIELQCPE